MFRVVVPSMLLGLVLCSATSAAGSATQQLKKGEPLGAFVVTKIAGAEDDRVAAGDQLCYRCRYGTRPMVIVFARQTDDRVVQLTKQIETAISDYADADLRGLVTFLGEDASELKDVAAAFATKSSVKQIPVVVAKDNATGPIEYKIDSDAAVTVVLGNDSEVVSSHVFAKADQIDVASLMKQVVAMVK